MTRKPTPKPAAKPDAQGAEAEKAATPPVTNPPETTQPAPQTTGETQAQTGVAAQPATQPESTLGDGDATGVAPLAVQVSPAPEAPAPDVGTALAPDGTAPSADVPQPAPVAGHIVRVVGPAAGRWRAGRKFGPEPVEIAASDLTDDEMQKIFGDPQLVAQVIGEA